jgi:metal-sulfur cluster biosynthetic enzyme
MRDIEQDEVIAVLKTVEDPELFLDIWFLGLIYNIDIDGSQVYIEMTFTTPMCPAGPSLIEEVKKKVNEIEGVEEVHVKVVFSPPWKPPEDVKEFLGL